MIFKKEIKKENYKATVEINLLPYSERIKLLKEMNFKVNNEGSLDSVEMTQVEKMIEITKSRIVSVNVKVGKKEIYDIEEMEFYAEWSEIINECMSVVIYGVKLGEVWGRHWGNK